MYPFYKSSLPASHRHVLDNKVILVIGDEQIERSWIRATLKNYGVKVILVDSKPNTFTSESVFKYIQYDFTDHRQDGIHAENIIQKLLSANLSIDGCCTFTDICGPIAAFVCEKLGLPGGVGVTGAMNVWKKSSTQIYFQKQTNGVHKFPRTYQYTGRTAEIVCKDTLISSIKKVGFPAICKPEHGAHGEGVTLIRDEEEWQCLKSTIETLLQDGKTMMLMEYFEGTEHDIEVIIYDGEIIAALVSDNGPTLPGSFVETSMSMPSCLPQPTIARLQTAASDCCIDIGLRNGVFNVEMMMTSRGPKLLEINGRMGGNYMRNWIYTCYRIDPLWYVMAISAGIRPTIPIERSAAHMMGITCSMPVHQKILSHNDFGMKIDALITTDEIQFFGKKYSDITQSSLEKSVVMCNVAVVRNDLESAKTALLEVCELLGIHNAKFVVPVYLSQFVPCN